MLVRHWLCGVGTLLLVACGSEPSAPPPTPPPPSPTAPQATVLDDQLRALEKARAVEATLEQSKDRTDAALEAAEGG